MNTKNSKTNEPHRFSLSLVDELNLKNPNKNMALANLRIYYTWKIIKSAYNNNNCKISAPTWNDEFYLPGGYYSIVDIPDYFEFIIKKHESLTEMLIASAKSRSARGASHQPAFMSGCLTISHTCLPCPPGKGSLLC